MIRALMIQTGSGLTVAACTMYFVFGWDANLVKTLIFAEWSTLIVLYARFYQYNRAALQARAAEAKKG